MAGIVFPLVIIFGSLIFGFAAIGFILIFLRSHRLRALEPTKDGAYITDYWILEKKDKFTKSLEWHSVFFQKKFRCEKPPKDAIQIGRRGRKYAEGYVLSDGVMAEMAWLRNVGLDNANKKGIVDVKEAFSVTDRATLTNQYAKAEEHNKNRQGWTADKVVALGLTGMFILFLIIFVIFAPDFFKAAKTFPDALTGTAKQLEVVVDKLEKVQCNQPITPSPTVPGITLPNTITTTTETPPQK